MAWLLALGTYERVGPVKGRGAERTGRLVMIQKPQGLEGLQGLKPT